MNRLDVADRQRYDRHDHDGAGPGAPGSHDGTMSPAGSPIAARASRIASVLLACGVADFARTSRSASARGIDERGVTSDRRGPTAIVLRAIAGALAQRRRRAWVARDRRRCADRGRRRRRHSSRASTSAPTRRALDRAQHALGASGRAPVVDVSVEGIADAAAALEARAVTITDRPQPTAPRGARRCRGRRRADRGRDRPPDRGAAARVGRRGPAPRDRRADADQGGHLAATACTRRMPRGRSATDRSSSAPPTSSSAFLAGFGDRAPRPARPPVRTAGTFGGPGA